MGFLDGIRSYIAPPPPPPEPPPPPPPQQQAQPPATRDSFTPAKKAGPVNLDGGSSGSSGTTTYQVAAGEASATTTNGDTTNTVKGKPGSVSGSQTTANADGSSQTTTATVGTDKATVEQKTTSADGSSTSSSVSAGPNGVSVSTTNTSAAGGSTSANVGVDGDGNVTVGASETQDKGKDQRGASFSITVGPDTIAGSVTINAKTEGGTGFSVTASAKQTDSQTTTTEGGMTVYNATSSYSVTVKGEVDAKVGGFSVGRSWGETEQYQVAVPSGAYDPSHPVDINNTDSMPPGTKVLMSSSESDSTEVGARYRVLKGKAEVKEESGVSVEIDKTDHNTVVVTAGPTEALTNSFSVGIAVGPAEVSVGKTSVEKSYTLKQVEFDLNTEEGRAAYQEFLLTGDLPEQNQPPGVVNAKTIQKDVGTETLRVEGKVGPFAKGIDLAGGNAELDSVTYPDGSADVTTILKPPAGPEVTITQHFNPPPPEPPGNEDPTKFQATIAYQGVGHNEAAQIYLSLTGDQAGADQIKAMDGDVSFTLTLNSDQMQALMGKFDAYYEQTGESHTWAGFVGEGNGPLVHPEDVGGSKPYWGAFAFGLTGYASDQVSTFLYVAATQGLPQVPADQVVVVDT